MSVARTVVVTGATGFIGKAVCRLLVEQDWRVVVVARDPKRACTAVPGAAEWIGYGDDALERAVAEHGRVIRLAGENPLARRWTSSWKAKMWSSRVDEAGRIATALARSPAEDRVLVSASGINIHAPDPRNAVTERSPVKSDWVGGMLAALEAAAEPAVASGVRVVALRIGVAIGREGGPLAFIDRPFRLGIGGHVGNGRQYVPWLHIDDMAAMLISALKNPAWRGPFIAAAPMSVTAKDFAACVGRQLGRKSWLHVPAPVARLALGEVATLVLSSYRADPGKAIGLGFRFRHSDLAEALASIYGPDTTEASETRLSLASS
jgi:uncharacterized protein (TIGR01777 family)